MNTLRFTGDLGFIYRQEKDCSRVSRFMLAEYQRGAKEKGVDFVMNKRPLEYRDGDVVIIRTAGKRSEEVDAELRRGLESARYTEVALGAGQILDLHVPFKS